MTTPANEPDNCATDPAHPIAHASSRRSADTPRSHRRGFWATQVLVLVPLWIAAYRDGHGGWYPTLDAAMTVLRSRDVFSSHFPMVGMYSSVSAKLGIATYFPGATQLYLLAIPVRLFGNAWGTLIGMATINSVWLLGIGWLLRRRLGDLGAIWAMGVVALLVFSMGSEALVDAAPMQMITIPFALFLVAVWSVADRDLGAIPVLAAVGNYLLLNHLVLTMLVPVIGICAPVGLFAALRAERRGATESWASTRRCLIRFVGIGAAVTVVLWLPTIIQQLTHSPGNLTNLYNASRIELPHSVSVAAAATVVVSMLGTPPFWLRPTFSTNGSWSPWAPAALAVGIAVVVAVFVGLGWLGVRRKDRLSVSALAIAAVALVAAAANILKAPTDYGYWNSYFRSLWPTMMFAWLAVGVAAVRSVPSRWFDSARIPTASLMTGVGAVAVVAGLAVPHVDPGTTNGSTDDSVTMAQPMIDRSVTLLKHRGQVEVSAGGDFSSLALTSTLVLALESYGVDVCVPADVVAQYGKHRACTKHGPNVYAMVSSAAFPPFPGQHVEWETTLLTRSEQRQRDRDAAKVRAWLATQHEVRVSPRVHHTLVEAYGFAGATGYERSQLDTHGAPPEALVFSPDFVTFIVTRSFWRPDGTADVAIDTGSLDPAVLLRWAELVYREYMGGSARVVSMKAAPGAAGTTGHHAK